MQLSQLMRGVSVRTQPLPDTLDIAHVQHDSRAVGAGDLFVAVRGFATDGHQYMDNAVAQGAVAVVCEQPREGLPCIVVDDARVALAQLAANFYGNPADALTIVGVTGTNGKTTTTYLIKHILEQQGYKVGLIGTNQNLIGDEVVPTERTTPESCELHALFAKMRAAGCTHVVMEVSSHSLVLHRVHGIRFAVGAFTNLTQDHLDFHHTMDEYRAAKALLFAQSDQAVLNLDEAAGVWMRAHIDCPCLGYACDADAAVRACDLALAADHVQFTAVEGENRVPVTLGIPGRFSVYNALTALTTARALDISLADAAAALATAHGVKGRVEVVPTSTPYTVLIDYAHTPDGVENVLRAVRGFAKGRVIALFGCGGDRDRTKRPQMGALAAQLADLCVVTSDNPRTESPEAILHDIVAGMQHTTTPYEVIADRRAAISWALAHARPDDVLVLMGKGHETYQEINHVKYPMDERQIVADCLAE